MDNRYSQMVCKMLLLILLSGMFIPSMAQKNIAGIVKDAATGNGLPYVNIGVKHKNIGVSSMRNGTFSLSIPLDSQGDTLSFSLVGYSDVHIPVRDFTDSSLKEVWLSLKVTELVPIQVSTKRLVEQQFGIKNSNAVLHFTDGSTNQRDIFEIAQLIKMDTALSKITSVNLHINEPRSDSGVFRINFYGFDGSRPTGKIVEKSIVQKKQITEGWLKFDVANEQIYLKKNFVAAIEFIPNEQENKPIYYEIKLGGSSRSFVRTSSQGEWSVPPHHYRMFVTALVAANKNKAREDLAAEKETPPTIRLYSQSVKDSFSIFVSLPAHYRFDRRRNIPVVYLLDANVYFDNVAAAMREQKTNAILVGIGYRDFVLMDSLRKRDYTYPAAALQDSFSVSGGADRFLSFIKDELFGYIHKNYACDTGNVTLMGHSFGGYFALYALQQSIADNKNIFHHYVAASPALDYGDGYLYKQFATMNRPVANKATLLMTFGGREDQEDGVATTEGMDGFNNFLKLLSGEDFKNIKVEGEVFPGFGHMETPVPTFGKYIQAIK